MWKLLKLILWVIPPVLLAGAVGLFLWYKKDIYQKEQKLGKEIKELRAAPAEKYDFGMEKFDQALAMMRDGKLEDGRGALLNMLRFHRDSARAQDAMRLLGQINLDKLFAPEANLPGKKRIEVGRGDSINKITANNQTTYQFLVKVNGLTRPEAIHPNDQLWVYPLNFRVLIDLRKKQLILMDGEYFFAWFPILDVRRPPGAKVPAKETIANKFGVLAGKRTTLTAEDALMAEKWIEIGKEWAIRSVAAGTSPSPGFGIFLSDADVDDLVAILRTGNSVEINP